jgi:UrcA family protein
MALGASHKRVIKYRHRGGDVMDTSITARSAGSSAKLALLVLGSVAGVMAAGAASAASPDNDMPAIVVKYSAQSLATDEGVHTLYRRITNAAKQVCPDASSRDLSRRVKSVQCQDQAIGRAIRQIDNSRLAALYAVHSKNS